MQTPSTVVHPETDDEDESLLSIHQVMRRTTVARSTIYHWLGQGLFPKPCQIGPRRVAWRKVDVDAWIAGKTRQS